MLIVADFTALSLLTNIINLSIIFSTLGKSYKYFCGLFSLLLEQMGTQKHIFVEVSLRHYRSLPNYNDLKLLKCEKGPYGTQILCTS